MYQKIFVPVDDSEASLAALHEACKIAQNSNAVVYITHVIDLANFSWGGAGYSQKTAEVHEASKAEGERVLAQTQEIVAKYQVKTSICVLEGRGGKVPTLLADEAKKQGCDLIIMGTHGWSGLMHMLMGSVAEGVLRQVDIPLMLIRKKTV